MRLNATGLMLYICMMCTGIACAEESETETLDCNAPLHAAPAAIKRTLGPLYRKNPPIEKLDAAYLKLRELVSGATNCRLHVQSPGSGSDRNLVREWISLHDWLSRLADFVYLESIGKARVDWEIEYADFADTYEFEA